MHKYFLRKHEFLVAAGTGRITNLQFRRFWANLHHFSFASNFFVFSSCLPGFLCALCGQVLTLNLGFSVPPCLRGEILVFGCGGPRYEDLRLGWLRLGHAVFARFVTELNRFCGSAYGLWPAAAVDLIPLKAVCYCGGASNAQGAADASYRTPFSPDSRPNQRA
jgi:hypothetical protein